MVDYLGLADQLKKALITDTLAHLRVMKAMIRICPPQMGHN